MSSKLLLDEPPLIVLPSLARLVGVNCALFLQQVHYWCTHYRQISDKRHFHHGRWWVWNPVTSQRGDEACWTVQFPFWSESTIKRIIAHLRTRKLLLVDRFNLKRYDRTNWYSVDEDALEAALKATARGRPLGQNDPMDQLTLTLSIGSSCTNASGQVDPMHEVNLNRPIPETTREKAEKNTQSPPTPSETWNQLCLPELEMSMTRVTYDRWIRPTRLVALTRDNSSAQATLLADDPYAREWLEERLHPTILRTLSGVLGIEAEDLTITYTEKGAEN